jgi:hypothetical protein
VREAVGAPAAVGSRSAAGPAGPAGMPVIVISESKTRALRPNLRLRRSGSACQSQLVRSSCQGLREEAVAKTRTARLGRQPDSEALPVGARRSGSLGTSVTVRWIAGYPDRLGLG